MNVFAFYSYSRYISIQKSIKQAPPFTLSPPPPSLSLSQNLATKAFYWTDEK